MNNSIYDNPNFVPNALPTIPDNIRVYSVAEVAELLHSSKNIVWGKFNRKHFRFENIE